MSLDLKTFLNGRNPFGTAPTGWDGNGTTVGITQQTPGYFNATNPSEGGAGYEAANPRVAANGTGVVIDGNWRQIGHLNQEQINKIVSDHPDAIKYDPEFGILANDKYVKPDTRGDALISALMFAAVGGAAGSGIMAIEGAGGGGALTGGMDTWEPGVSYTGGSAPGGAAGGGSFGPGGFDGWEPGTGYTGGSAPGGIPEAGQFPYMDNIADPTTTGPMNNISTFDGYNAPINTQGLPPTQTWYERALQAAMNDPVNTARTGMGLYSMVNSLAGQHGSSALVGSNGGDGSGGPSGPAPMFTPDLQSQFQMNPYLLRPVPFMSGG